MMDGLPLHKMLSGHNECNIELIQWMVEQYPDSMVHKTIRVGTPLYNACTVLQDSNSTNMAEICKFFIRRCPQSVRIAADRSGVLPIHLLGRKCHYREVQEIGLLLLYGNILSHIIYLSICGLSLSTQFHFFSVSSLFSNKKRN